MGCGSGSVAGAAPHAAVGRWVAFGGLPEGPQGLEGVLGVVVPWFCKPTVIQTPTSQKSGCPIPWHVPITRSAPNPPCAPSTGDTGPWDLVWLRSKLGGIIYLNQNHSF